MCAHSLSANMRLPVIGGLTAVAAAALIVVVALIAGATHYCLIAAGTAGLPTLAVSGDKLLAGDRPVRVLGVNRSGTEYACVQNWGIFDGPSDEAGVQAIASWHTNFVRIPLNEDCWLGINQGSNSASFYGQSYRQAIVDYVALLHQHGIYAELSLIWGAPGSYPATYQPGGPDADHSPALWASLAQTFRDDGAVILAPWGETTTGWKCFRDGCADQATYGPQNTPYQTAGMQQAVDVMRQAGYKGPIAIPCIAYANRCADYNNGSWLQSQPTDPAHQLVAEAHVYGKNACDSISCFDASLAPLAAKVPMIWGETGESYDNSECGTDWINMALGWADKHGVGYMAWTWDVWPDHCNSLISTYAGAPSPYGEWMRQHYAAAAAAAIPTAVPRPSPSSTASNASRTKTCG